MTVEEIKTQSDFTAILTQNKLVLIDFYATWCGPCKAIEGQIKTLSTEYTSVKFIKVDIDVLKDVAKAFGIKSIPTFITYKNGSKFGSVSGANPTSIKQMLNKLVAK